jgi:hypothetical protein
MFSVQILIPVCSNNGERIAREHHAVFEELLVHCFGGFTRGTEVYGGFMGIDGVIYEQSAAYNVAARSLFECGKFRETVAFALRHYDQEAILLSFLGVVEIVAREQFA